MNTRQGVLLVGGNGFLGAALARKLVAAGRQVHVLSRHLEPGVREGIGFHRGGQDEVVAVSPLLRTCGTVVHLASTTTPGSSARNPIIDSQENLLPAARLLETMAGMPPERLVFVSSGGSIYGNPDELPVRETQRPDPLSFHAAGKIALEALFSAFAHSHSIPLAILRPSNIYGPGQALRGGFGVVRTLLDRALQDEPFEIWGAGTVVRDYLFIDDAVDAGMKLLGAPSATGIFNVGSGRGTSIAELVELVIRTTGRDLKTIERPSRCTDVKAVVLDCERLAAATGWTAKTGLEQGLQKTWKWLCESEK